MSFRFTSSHLYHVFAIISILLTVCFLFDRDDVSSNQLALLLEGDDSVDLSHIEAFGQHRHLECHDPQAIQYLKRCLAASTPNGNFLPETEEEIRCHSGYVPYYITFGLDSGQECTMYCDVSNHDICLLVPSHQPVGEVGAPNRRAHFPQPMPAKLTTLLDALTAENAYD